VRTSESRIATGLLLTRGAAGHVGPQVDLNSVGQDCRTATGASRSVTLLQVSGLLVTSN
jgi:hypothetical protein